MTEKVKFSLICLLALLFFLSGGLLVLSVALSLVFVRVSFILRVICACAMCMSEGAWGAEGGVPTLTSDRKSW